MKCPKSVAGLVGWANRMNDIGRKWGEGHYAEEPFKSDFVAGVVWDQVPWPGRFGVTSIIQHLDVDETPFPRFADVPPNLQDVNLFNIIVFVVQRGRAVQTVEAPWHLRQAHPSQHALPQHGWRWARRQGLISTRAPDSAYVLGPVKRVRHTQTLHGTVKYAAPVTPSQQPQGRHMCQSHGVVGIVFDQFLTRWPKFGDVFLVYFLESHS